MASTTKRSCKSSANKSCKSSKSMKVTKTSNNTNTCVHVPFDNDMDYPIDVVRATLKSVLSPMGYRFTVRSRENDSMGEYASISITPPNSSRSRKSS